MQHFLVSWHAEAEPAEQHKIFDQLASCLKAWDHYRPFPHCAIVRVGGNGHYELVHKKLLACATQFPAEQAVQFVMTPLKERGLYNGRMTDEAATQLNKLSE